jgi:hypothetical protein
MNALASLSTEELRRQDQLSAIADWYREEASFHEIERSGRDVLFTVDHMARVIRVESFDRYAAQRTPIEERMEFDADVLSRMKAALSDRNHVVILDCSDVPGKLGFGRESTRGLSARVLVVDIDSGEVRDEKTIMKEHPDFPERLRRELLAVPKVEGASYLIRRAHLAERFVDEYLQAPTDSGCQQGSPRL